MSNSNDQQISPANNNNPVPPKDNTGLKIAAVLVAVVAAVTWSLTVLFALSIEKALAMVVLGTVGVVVMLIATGLSPF